MQIVVEISMYVTFLQPAQNRPKNEIMNNSVHPEDYGIARAYRDTGRPVELPVYGTGRIPVQERHRGTSEMLVPVDIDLENNTVPVPIPVPIERILLDPP